MNDSIPTRRPRRPSRRLLALLFVAALAIGGCKSSSDDETSTGESPSESPETAPADEPAETPPTPDDEARVEPPTVSPAVQEMVAGRNQFGFDLFKRAVGASEGNVVIAPSNLTTALSMAYVGARGSTAEQMHTAMRLSQKEPTEVARLENELREALASVNTDAVELVGVSRVFANDTVEIDAGFLATLAEHFDAETELVDFAGDPVAVAEHINAWASDHTRGRIPELLPLDAVDAKTRAVLTSAVYFDAKWAAPFPVEDTSEAEFETLDGQTVTVPMLHRSGQYDHFEDDEVQVLELPYAGERLSMLVILPTKREVVDLVENLNSKRVAGWVERLAPAEVDVALPRFELTWGTELSETLSELGMDQAFDTQANFTGITEAGDVSLGAVVHEVYLSVDEEGTEAAAATAVTVQPTSVRQSVEFTADHPFLFVIRDVATDDILFLGRVADPSASASR